MTTAKKATKVKTTKTKAEPKKSNAKSWSKQLKEARDMGYVSGYRDAARLSDKVGMKSALRVGHSKGVKDNALVRRIEKRLKKKENQPKKG